MKRLGFMGRMGAMPAGHTSPLTTRKTFQGERRVGTQDLPERNIMLGFSPHVFGQACRRIGMRVSGRVEPMMVGARNTNLRIKNTPLSRLSRGEWSWRHVTLRKPEQDMTQQSNSHQYPRTPLQNHTNTRINKVCQQSRRVGVSCGSLMK
jgi:hypothetical protein